MEILSSIDSDNNSRSREWLAIIAGMEARHLVQFWFMVVFIMECFQFGLRSK